MAVMRRGMRSLKALMNSSTIYATPIFRSYSTSTSSTAPPLPEKCVAALLHVFNVSSVATEIKVVPNALLPRVVIFDGVSRLFHIGAKLLIKADKDKKIMFCCLQSKTAEPYMKECGLKREDVLRRVLIVEGPGVYHQGSTACLRILSYLPPPYSELRNLIIIPTPWRDALYDYVAEHRYDWFGKDEYD